MRPSVTGLLSLVVAVSAATLADPIVEHASNSGVFGAGSFTDRSTIDVLPAAIAALGLAIAYVFVQARRSLARELLAAPSPRMPLTFALQLLVLFGMESVEQLVVAGHPLGGSVWLGGPIVVALVVHALVCVALSLLLTRVLASLAQVAARVRDVAIGVCPAHGRRAWFWRATGARPALLRDATSTGFALGQARAAESFSLGNSRGSMTADLLG